MAHIDRPPKTGGTRRYTNEVAAGFDLIRETEVDGDLDIVYGEVNGGLDDTNIRPGASIDYSKLDLTGRLQGSDFDPTPTTPLPPGAYGPGGIPVSALPPLDTPQLALGAATQAAQTASYLGAVGDKIAPNGIRTLVVEVTWTSRGTAAVQWVSGVFGGDVPTLGADALLDLALILDGTAGDPNTGTILATMRTRVGGAAVIGPVGLSIARHWTGLAAGVHRLKLAVFPTNPAGNSNVLSGIVSVIEFA
jgi:hypothetical protein